MVPHSLTPDWAVSCVKRIIKTDDPDQLDALLELLAGIAPTEEEEKYKYDVAWAAIDFAYQGTADCHISCRQYLGVAS